MLYRFKVWLLSKGWYWTRCKGCGKFSHRHHMVRGDEGIQFKCHRCENDNTLDFSWFG